MQHHHFSQGEEHKPSFQRALIHLPKIPLKIIISEYEASLSYVIQLYHEQEIDVKTFLFSGTKRGGRWSKIFDKQQYLENRFFKQN